ncbi:MAG: 3-phosphoshikimate 1-carboxyvinyltransferase [Candidatus Omnitrophota bacterium]|nr:3-phosphoshikimate 1-carboxyvinyltransferase [Candidatus Omnitrophota bacterium]
MKAVEILIPPDKSISHRAVMLASVSEGQTIIKNLLISEDIKRTIEAFQAMGVTIIRHRVSPRTATHGVGQVIVKGVGMHGLKKPARPLYLGNSGTTMRILPGILAGQDFEVVLTGDASLSKRPMKRIVEPLRKMGAESASVIASEAKQSHEIYPPLKIHGGKLKPIKYKSKIASAQVKSCILFAGLYADGVASVAEPVQSRDHTERMLRMFGCRLKAQGSRVSFRGPVNLKSPGTIEIPGDISSAAFFMIAGCILPDIKIIIKNVGLNPTRTGVLDILRKMGADIDFSTHFVRSKNIVRAIRRRRRVENKEYFEPTGDIVVKTSKLKGVTISPEEVVRAIDEIPILMVAACFAKGKTVIKGIEELKVKETDRVKSMITNLQKLGADIDLCFSTHFVRSKNIVRARRRRCRVENEEKDKSFIVINGGKELHGAKVLSFGDHRTAMSMLIAGLRIKGKVVVTGLECINKSFPNFIDLLNRLSS